LHLANLLIYLSAEDWLIQALGELTLQQFLLEGIKGWDSHDGRYIDRYII